MGKRDRDERDVGSNPVVTPTYTGTSTSAPTQNTSAPDPVRNTGGTRTSGPATMPTSKSQPGTGGIKTNPDAGKGAATSIASSYGESHSGSIGTGKTQVAKDPVIGSTDGPRYDPDKDSYYYDPNPGDRWMDNAIPAVEHGTLYTSPDYTPFQGDSRDGTPLDTGTGTNTGGDTRTNTGGGGRTTNTNGGRPIKTVRTGRTQLTQDDFTGTQVQTSQDAPDKNKTKNGCKPRPKDNRPKGGGGGGKKRGFIPWCG